MSERASSNPSQPEGREERRKSIGNYVKRIGSILKRDSSKRSETPTATTASSSRTQPIEVADSATPSTQSQQAVPSSSEKQLSSSKAEPTVTGPGKYVRSAVQEERARNLFAKYGLTLEAHEWISVGGGTTTVQVERVEKPIRMRVTRTCHRCNVTFGPDKICSSCEHKRCKKCPRYPVKKNKTGSGDVKGKGKSKGDSGGTVAATAGKGRKKDVYTLRTRSGQERTFDQPRQRIKRTCHLCQTQFNPPSLTVCSNCQHVRCTACPREPAKPKKWPEGYPGDAIIEEESPSSARPDRTWRKPRRRVRWFCSECSVMFMEGSKVCAGCNHERCDKCYREPPKKAKKEYDPEVLKQVEERLAQYKVGD